MPRRQYSFVTALQNLTINRPLGSNWEIGGGLKISTSRSVAERLVTDALSYQAGSLEANNILSGNPFLYSISDYPFEDTSVEVQLSLLLDHLVKAQQFVNVLWLIKDNSVNFELGFLQHPYDRRSTSTRVTSNYLSSLFSTATGERLGVVFDIDELTSAITLANNIPDAESSGSGVPSYTFTPEGKTDRVSRALYFVQGARAMVSLPEKSPIIAPALKP